MVILQGCLNIERKSYDIDFGWRELKGVSLSKISKGLSIKDSVHGRGGQKVDLNF